MPTSTLPLIPLTGTIRTPEGSRFNGSLRMTLSYSACRQDLDADLIVAQRVIFPIVNGSLPSGARITPNDILEPEFTWYTAEYFSTSGASVAKNHFYIEGDAFDIGEAHPMPITTSNISFSNIRGDAANLMFLQAGTGAEERTVQDKLRETVSVKDFGATGDGVTDDTAAIQFAVNSLVNTGGAIHFPRGRYRITSTITVQSLYPISLVGDMYGFHEGSPNASAILLGATIAGPMIRYTAPNPAARGAHGGGRIEGLAFIDASIRTYTCTAVLDLNDFVSSSVLNCVFQRIKGRAILGGFVVQSEIANNQIRYCGDTAKPAIDLPSVDLTHPTQSLSIRSNRMEVNYGDAYIKIPFNANGNAITITDNRFEAESTDVGSADDSNHPFLDLGTPSCRIVGNSLNRNAGIQVLLSGKNNLFMGNTLLGGVFPATAVLVTGNSNALTGNTAASARTGLEFDLQGRGNTLIGNTFFFSGGIRANAALAVGNIIAHNTLFDLTCTAAVLGATDKFWINTYGGTSTKIVGNVLSNSSGTVFDCGGIQTYSLAEVSGNSLNSFSPNTGLYVRGEQENITNNILVNAPFVVETYANNFFSGNYTSGGINPLQASVAFPSTLFAVDEVVTVNVACPGVAYGDFVDVGLDSLTGQMLVTPVANPDVVYVVFKNVDTVPITVGAGTLKVSVRKR